MPSVPSFLLAFLKQDFIALALSPPNLKPSPLLELQMTIPIRLVTDSWGDLTLLDTAGI